MASKSGRVSLTQHEIEMFQQPNWLNDSCVEWWIEKMVEQGVPASRQHEVYPLSPSAVQLTKDREFTKEAIKDDFASLALDQKALVLMPINDHDTLTESGGTHWGLLVYERSTNTFRLYDSLKGIKLPYKRQQAQAVMKKMSLCLGAVDAKFEVEAECPQQDNGFDCGAIVCLVAGLVVRSYLNNNRKPLAEELAGITASGTADARRKALKRAQRDPMFGGIPSDRLADQQRSRDVKQGVGRLFATIVVAIVYWVYFRKA